LFTPAVLTYDARGNGEGVSDSTLSGDHQNRVTDYTAMVMGEERTARMTAFGEYVSDGTASTIKARDYKDATEHEVSGVPRRLTPRECERLMGWPDDHTTLGVNERGEEYALSDTPRYKLCGNGVASPVAAWIGHRLRAAIEAAR
jgi:DNA (cytosine-5)-methyltransferase 1